MNYLHYISTDWNCWSYWCRQIVSDLLLIPPHWTRRTNFDRRGKYWHFGPSQTEKEHFHHPSGPHTLQRHHKEKPWPFLTLQGWTNLACSWRGIASLEFIKYQRNRYPRMKYKKKYIQQQSLCTKIYMNEISNDKI